ncbi:MAG: hypothetical protein DHS20C12_14830 [Pseudohongiella sp.]|nr:MAG: hypothetical protein DHS20C12_14830 [Pseudohongiella sp.]
MARAQEAVRLLSRAAKQLVVLLGRFPQVAQAIARIRRQDLNRDFLVTVIKRVPTAEIRLREILEVAQISHLVVA